jgi:hypothetical protein
MTPLLWSILRHAWVSVLPSRVSEMPLSPWFVEMRHW